MARESIIEALGDIARDKGISRDRLQEVIQEAVTAAAKRKYKDYNEVEARINVTSGELEVFRYKTVTEDFQDPENEIPLDEARKLDSLAAPGDEVEYEIDNQELSRVIAQTARQLIFQRIREAERETIYENFKDRKGEILNGIVSRTERNRIFITFNQVEAILYKREQIPNERYSSGEHIRVMLMDVINDPKEPSQLVISRADPQLLIKLFEMEVPEIYDGIVEIVAAAREAGRRAKIAVRSNDTDVDPVGACVGMRGSRVQSIIAELRGEKIDIINWTDELPTYIANSLAPAELTRIRIDEELEEIDVEVEPDQLSLAIGRQGQNVRIASKLIGYKININSTQDKTLTLEEQIRERLLASQAQLTQQAEGTDEGGTGIFAEAAALLSGEDAPSMTGESAEEAAPEDATAAAEQGEGAPTEESTEETAAGAEQGEEAPAEESTVTAEQAEEAPTEESAVTAEQAEEAPAQESAEESTVTAEQGEEAPTEESTVVAEQGEEAPAEESAVVTEQAEEAPTEESAAGAEQGEDAPAEESAVVAEQAEDAPAEESTVVTEQAEEAPAEESAEESTVAAEEVPKDAAAAAATPEAEETTEPESA